MLLEGLPTVELGSVQDRIRNTVWYRRKQEKIFETLINVYASMISISPDVAKKVEGVIDDYIDLIVPGSKEFRKQEAQNTLNKNKQALDAIYRALASKGSSNPFATK